MDMVLTDQDLTDMFDDFLDEQGTVEVCGIAFDPSRVLKECDPIAYRIARDEYADSLVEDGYEVEGY